MVAQVILVSAQFNLTLQVRETCHDSRIQIIYNVSSMFNGEVVGLNTNLILALPPPLAVMEIVFFQEVCSMKER